MNVFIILCKYATVFVVIYTYDSGFSYLPKNRAVGGESQNKNNVTYL